MIGTSSSIELEKFEQIEEAPGTALLRVAARQSAQAASIGASTLVVDDGVRHARSSEVLAAERADHQRLAENRLAAAIEAHDDAQARASTLEQVVRTESERSAQLPERVGRVVAELAALAAARTGAEEAVAQLRGELETARAQRQHAEATSSSRG